MINLKEIDEDNFQPIVDMEVDERYLSSNVYSLAQCYLYRKNNDVFPFGIYFDVTLIGFLLLDVNFEEKETVIWRIALDKKYQNQGFGTKAILKIIDFIKENYHSKKIIIDYKIGNEIARHVYEKVGFLTENKVVNGDEIEMFINV